MQLPLFDAIEVPLSQGKVALIDPCDADLLEFKWYTKQASGNRTVYAARNDWTTGKPRTVRLHRVILAREIGRELLPKEDCDHIDCDGLNNCRANLRLANRSENICNVRKRSDNASGYKGVGYHKGKWRARIGKDGISHELGEFDSPEEAYAAYCKAAIELHGEFARLD